MSEYILFLVTDEPMTDGYFSNKQLVDGGDLIYLDDFTTGFYDAQDLGNSINHSNNKFNFIHAIIVPKKEYLNMIKNKEQLVPKKILKVLFSEHRDYYEKLMGRDGSVSAYIGNLIFRDYFEYLCNHKFEIKNSLIKYVRVPGIAVDEFITPNQLQQVFYAYYGSDNNLTKIPYRKIRDTYLELQKYYARNLKKKR